MAFTLIIGIGLLILGLLTGQAPFTALGIFVLLVDLLNRFWLRRVMRSLKFLRLHEDHAFLGDTVIVRLKIQNTSNLPLPWLALEERVPTQLALEGEGRKNWVLNLPGNHTEELTYELRAVKRGRYRLGPLEGSGGTIYPESSELSGEPLTWNLTSFLTVYPLIVPLERLGLPSRLPQGNIRSNRSLLPDPSLFAGVHDYVPGDDPRHINWSSSARTGRLQVKEFDRSQLIPLAIFLDLDRESYMRSSSWLASECGVAVAASLANYAARLGQQVGLYTNGRDPFVDNPEGLTEIEANVRSFKKGGVWYAPNDSNENKAEEDEKHADIKLPPHSGTGQLTLLLETLARVQLWNAKQSLPALMSRWSSELSWGATVAVIAPRPTPELVGAMVRLRKIGFAVFSVFTEESYNVAHSAAVRAMGFTSFDVTHPEELNAGRTATSR